MRVVGVSRVLDEADMIEPFIRHHAALLDLHIVLDNGSSDGTLDILRALHGEGVKLQVFQTESPIFLEQAYNTGLYQLAVGAGADWVMFLDADELLVVRDAPLPHDVLASVPDGIACLRVQAYDYVRPEPEFEAHPFTALRRRAQSSELPKIVVRRLDPGQVGIYAGNHVAYIDGVADSGVAEERLAIAHVPDRSPLQVARKTILARMKPMASGAGAAGHFGTHRMATFEALKRDAGAWLQRGSEVEDLVDDPVRYLGGALRYTAAPDELGRFISLLTIQAEQLARSHGEILDRKRLVKAELVRRGGEIRRVV